MTDVKYFHTSVTSVASVTLVTSRAPLHFLPLRSILLSVMWPFRRKKKKDDPAKKKDRTLETVVAGVIIGAAVSSIIGKKMLDRHEKNEKK